MNLNYTFTLDRVFILSSVTGNHLQTAKDLYNYHINIKNKQFIEVHSKDQLIEALQSIESVIDIKSGPIIHIEAHGLESGEQVAKSYGIELSNGDNVYWEEIRPYLTNINAKCGNNLTMVMASCFGMYILQDLIKTFFDDIVGSKCPFLQFVGPESKASIEDFSEAFPVFYKTLDETKSFIDSVQKMNNYTSNKFRCDNVWTTYMACIDDFANKQIKTRLQYIQKDPTRVLDYFCQLYEYTYQTKCDINAVLKIISDESFYIDYLNKRREEFLHIKNKDYDRFPLIDKLDNFEKSTPLIFSKKY